MRRHVLAQASSRARRVCVTRAWPPRPLGARKLIIGPMQRFLVALSLKRRTTRCECKCEADADAKADANASGPANGRNQAEKRATSDAWPGAHGETVGFPCMAGCSMSLVRTCLHVRQLRGSAKGTRGNHDGDAAAAKVATACARQRALARRLYFRDPTTVPRAFASPEAEM